MTLTKTSAARIETFVDEFIRSEHVQNWTAERDSDFFNEPERAARVADAAEFGGDGKTHAEVIGDWRDAFDNWIRERKGSHWSGRFTSAVEAHFDSVEAFHEQAGTLHQEIG